MKLPITPETRVGALLEAYPGIDDVLADWVPAFAKLKNPLLRKTVAKVATLEQAAKVGGVSVRDLVRKLREATGQSGPEIAESPDEFGGDTPAWVAEDQVRHFIDADRMLEKGVHPIGQVRENAASLGPGELVKLTSSFRPEPLIEAMRKGGFQVYACEPSPGRHATYIGRSG